MRSKILFSALLGGFALASCTSDEDINSLPAKQESPIQFSVSYEEEESPETRASMTSTMKLNFTEGDLMSLFHGIAAPLTAMTGYQNAIYEAGPSDDGSSLVFRTRSMVLPNGAIMVYPADTTFANNGTADPVLSIPVNQNANTKLLTPYMSEILNIAAYSGTNAKNVAGYGKTYDIVLKRVGTAFTLVTVPSNTDKIDNSGAVNPLKVTNVELSTTGADFVVSVPAAYNAAVPAAALGHPLWSGLWANVSEVDMTSAVKNTRLATTDITNNYRAEFTLLPNTGTTLVGGKVVITTNYGTVTLVDATGAIMQSKLVPAVPLVTVTAGLQEVLDGTWSLATAGVFKGENVGKRATRTINADMSTIDMNNLHIKDQQHLMDALKVLAAINKPAVAPKFILDGDVNGQFVMDAAATAAYQAELAKAVRAVSFDIDPTCTAGVVFRSTVETEIPNELDFVTPVAVTFDGLWKYTNDAKAFFRVTSLNFAPGATVSMNGIVSNGTQINNRGTVNVDAVSLRVPMTNYGTLNIPLGKSFKVHTVAFLNQENGMINNSDILGVQSGTTGTITNFGTIEQKTADAYTYVTNNGGGTADFAFVKANPGNILGTIKLFGMGNDNTIVAGIQGFIKVVTNVAEVDAAAIGSVANYIHVTGDCTKLKNLPPAVKFVEIESNRRVRWESAAVGDTVDGLIVRAGRSLNIPVGSTVIVNKAIYVKGMILQAGTFNYAAATFVGYLSGLAGDVNNIIAQ